MSDLQNLHGHDAFLARCLHTKSVIEFDDRNKHCHRFITNINVKTESKPVESRLFMPHLDIGDWASIGRSHRKPRGWFKYGDAPPGITINYVESLQDDITRATIIPKKHMIAN